MSNQLHDGQGRDINVFAGQSLAVSSIVGTYTATIIAGAGIGTALATDSTGGATYGPYSGGVTVRLKAGEGALLDYEAAVNPVLNYAGPARLGYSAAGDTSSLVDGAGNKLLPQPGTADKLMTQYSANGVNFAGAVGLTMGGVTDMTISVTNDYPRWTAYSRKLALGATGASAVNLRSFPPFAANPIDLAFQIEIYIENYLTEFAGASNPYIDIAISSSTGTSIGANYSRWSIGAQGLKQGWNTIKIRSADTVSGSAGAGNLPLGMSRPADVGTGFNFATESVGFVNLAFTNMPSQNVYVDQMRVPGKAQSVLVLGWDASGYNPTDDVFPNKVAPLMAQYGARGYCTFTYEYELLYAGSRAWKRLASLYNTYGWDIVNHSWSHGAGVPGVNQVLTSLVAASDVVTATYPAAHGLAIGTKYRARIRGASIAVCNVISEWTVTTTTQATATIAGSGSATATGTITLNTFLGEILSTDTAENRRVALHEFRDNSDAMKATGFARGTVFAPYPNGSYCEKAVMEYAAAGAGIKIGRGYRGGYTPVTELGIDNPLACGAYEMNSGASGMRTSILEGRITAAISRGDHIHIFGHYPIDDTDPANAAYAPLVGNGAEYPPGMNGNPAPPANGLGSVSTGWWYYSQLALLFSRTIGPAIANGTLLVMSPSEYVAYLGYKV